MKRKPIPFSSRLLVLLLLVVAAFFSRGLLAQGLVINEIHYDPPDPGVAEEFVELYNPGDAQVDASGWFFSEGIRYVFPAGTRIPSKGFLVVAEDPDTMRSVYGAIPVVGPWEGNLSNDGETLTLRDAAAELVDQVDYQVEFPWPLASAGAGCSMELIHPSLDNDLGGSWRASGSVGSGHPTREYIVPAQAPQWHYRKGTSNPAAGWRDLGFTEDASWLVGQAGFGYDDGDDTTVLSDMRNNYGSLYLRRTFEIARAEDIPTKLGLGIYADDGAIVWLNGREVARVHVTDGEKNYNDFALNHDAEWEEFAISSPASALRVGTNLIAVHCFNVTIASSDLSIDASLFIPSDSESVGGPPTPGAPNSVLAENAPPQVRQVGALVAQPVVGQVNHVTAKVSDPDGVRSVELEYQVVRPGQYIPAFLPVPLASLMANAEQPRPPNPAFEDPANWTTVVLRDDGTGADRIQGDGTYTVVLPAQENRTLVRYRVRATDTRGESVRVPYADDPSLNFAYYVYDGVPDYFAQTSILGAPTTHPAAALESIPVYILLTRNEDILEARAADVADQIPQGNEARFAENWEGTFVYDGHVYDHITYRLRGANGRYQIPPSNPTSIAGKRHWRFRFNEGDFLRAKDKWGHPYPTRWKWLDTCRMFGNRLDGNWGLGDMVNDILWNAYDVPAPYGHYFHWRVVDGPEEAPAGAGGQYAGDFWGIARAFENYDGRFLEARGLPKGNLYKLVNQTNVGLDQQRYQAPGAVSDGSDHDNIEANLRYTQSDAWLDAYVEYGEWYRYHAIAQALRHYDYWPEANKNATWYFYPDYKAENGFLGRMWTLPFDADATWGPTWNDGRDRPYEAIYGGTGKPRFQRDYRARIREVRDLLWQQSQLEPIIRQTAAFIDAIEEADIDRWRNGTVESGRQYFPSAREATLEGKIRDMLNFAFVGGSWPGGDVGAGGRAAFLDSFADGPDAASLPRRPTVTYTGDPTFPIDGLTFRSSDFSDPQGAGTFGAMKWRVAEVTQEPGSLLLSDPAWKAEPVKPEIRAAWESEDIVPFRADFTIPPTVVGEGKRYRVRVRMQDSTDLWSHWSPPVEFVAGAPTAAARPTTDLRISEVMYSPTGGTDFEFIEIVNRGSATADLDDVRFTDGIEFAFRDGAVTGLGAGQMCVVVRNLEAFSRRYDTSSILVAGEYAGRLDSGGETIALSYGLATEFLRFTYQDDWYPETDGLGYSLNIQDPDIPLAAWNDAASWFPSGPVGGTPGRPDPSGDTLGGYARPGDGNADGRLDVSDALALLLILFGGSREPPCEAGPIADGGNLSILDFSGDEAVNVTDAIALLRFLFQSGPPHALGPECRRIQGCPRSCVSG